MTIDRTKTMPASGRAAQAGGDWQPRRVAVAETTVRALVLGAGDDVVVCLNGMGVPLEQWAWIAPALAGEARVLLYDRGQSQRRVTLDASVDELGALLGRLAPVGRLVLVGHSWGACVARLFASRHGADGLVLLDPPHETALMASRPRLLRGQMRLIDALTRIPVIADQVMRAHRLSSLPPWCREDYRRRLRDDDLRAQKYAEARAADVASEQLGRDCPVDGRIPTHLLLADDEHDAVTLTRRSRAAWHAGLVNAVGVQVSDVSGTGHFVTHDRPDAVLIAVRDMLGRPAHALSDAAPPKP